MNTNPTNTKESIIQNIMSNTLDMSNYNGSWITQDNHSPSLTITSPPLGMLPSIITNTPAVDGYELHMKAEQGVAVLRDGSWYRKSVIDAMRLFQEDAERKMFGLPSLQEALKQIEDNLLQEEIIGVQIKILKELNPEKLETISHQLEEIVNTPENE